MAKVNFTASRVESFKPEAGKAQSFLWDAKSQGLGLRVTRAGARSYIFQAKLHGATLRVTIGDPRSWSIDQAQEEARRLQRMIDEGIDPRELKTQKEAAIKAEQVERQRADVTFGEAWDSYVEERKAHWGGRHYLDHIRHAAVGMIPHKKGKALIKPGPLSILRPVKLVDINADCIAHWLGKQNEERPTMAALSYRLLRAFIRWAHETEAYQGLISENAHSARRVKENVARVKTKAGDCLQREQLQAWFSAVIALDSPVISAYLQGLVLTGARREELAVLRWEDVDFKWRSISLKDKVDTDTGRVIPLTPYFASVLLDLKKRNEVRLGEDPLGASLVEPSPWVFYSSTAAGGRLVEPRIAHNKALSNAGLPHVTLHGLRRSFSTLSEWVECPTGVVAQIQGHKPSAIVEKHYHRRPLDMLRMWHDKIEAWMLNEAKIMESSTMYSLVT